METQISERRIRVCRSAERRLGETGVRDKRDGLALLGRKQLHRRANKKRPGKIHRMELTKRRKRKKKLIPTCCFGCWLLAVFFPKCLAYRKMSCMLMKLSGSLSDAMSTDEVHFGFPARAIMSFPSRFNPLLRR